MGLEVSDSPATQTMTIDPGRQGVQIRNMEPFRGALAEWEFDGSDYS